MVPRTAKGELVAKIQRDLDFQIRFEGGGSVSGSPWGRPGNVGKNKVPNGTADPELARKQKGGVSKTLEERETHRQSG